MSGKQLPPPAAGGPDLTALLRSRHARTDDTPPAAPAALPPTPQQQAPQRPGRSDRTPMDRRSWYMPKQAADALAEAVEELHYTTRQPKHAVVAALVSVALAHLAEAEQQLTTKH